MKKLNSLFTLILIALFFTGCSIMDKNHGLKEQEHAITRGTVHVDNIAPSTNAPGNLKPEETPQFVSLGFDDNAYSDSLVWIRDFLVSNQNFIEGSGNPKNFDGQTAKASFFMTGQYLTSQGLVDHGGNTIEKMRTVLTNLYNDGNEIANHTFMHTSDKSVAELTRCNDVMVNLGIVPRNEIFGFRAPNLSYDNTTIATLYNMNFLYDCSIEDDWNSHKNGKNELWPFTLDNGSPYPQSAHIGNYPGMWELPVASIHVAGQNRLEAAFDYNLWVTRKLSKDQFVQTLKDALDARIDGNRAPFTFGGHTDEYSEFNSALENYHTPNSTWQERRAAIEEFLLYALSKPMVRVVSYMQIIDWMRDPQPLTGSAVVKPEPKPNPDPSIPAWDSNKVYLKGDKTNYDYTIWVARWYTQGEIPGSSPVWTPIK